MTSVLDDELTALTLPDYLRARGIASPDAAIDVAALSGGISNVVLLAEWPGGSIVVKQSLPRLRVAAEWKFDRARIFAERNCMETLSHALPGAAPAVVFSDDDRYLFGMTRVPAGGVVWKDALLAGEIVASSTEAAGRMLGRLQSRTAADRALATRFGDLMPLMQGRVEPYHRTAASAHPDLAAHIDDEVQRLLGTRSVLVHGDYSPKNLVAYPDRMMILDFEVAHWGDPAFDSAFLLSHLVLKAFHRPALADRFMEEAARFWRTYAAAVEGVAIDDRAVVAELGCLLLARVDGKSPVEYLVGEAVRDAVRRAARSLLIERTDDVERALARVGATLDA